MADNKFLQLEGIRGIKKANISDELFNYFKDAIISGKLEPGSLLPSEFELCENSGVSRSTMREVLSALSFMNLIIRTKRGSFINDHPNLYNTLPFPEVLRKMRSKDIINFRIILESEIVGLVVKNANNDDIQELEDALTEMKKSEDINALMKADSLFHIILAKASHNELFFYVLQRIRDELESQIYDSAKNESVIKRAIAHHEKILAAVKKGDVKQAKKAIIDHIQEVSETIDRLNP